MEEITLNRSEIAKSLGTLINELRQLLSSNLDITLLGDPVARVPHVLAAVIKDIDGEALASGLSKKGVPGLQRDPKAKPPRLTYSIFRSDCHLPAMDSADRR